MMPQERDEAAIPVDRMHRMHRRPGHLLRRAHQMHGALWAAQVSRDVTPTQFSALTVIAENSGCDQAAVAREASLDTSTAGDVVFRMVKRGWVQIDRDPVDRRRNLLSLTDLGRDLYASVDRSAASMTTQLVAKLSLEQREQLIDLLQQLLGDDDLS